jgi:hypothetical protein
MDKTAKTARRALIIQNALVKTHSTITRYADRDKDPRSHHLKFEHLGQYVVLRLGLGFRC